MTICEIYDLSRFHDFPEKVANPNTSWFDVSLESGHHTCPTEGGSTALTAPP